MTDIFHLSFLIFQLFSCCLVWLRGSFLFELENDPLNYTKRTQRKTSNEKMTNEKCPMTNDKWSCFLTANAIQHSQTEVCATSVRSMDG
ncbi:MAG: hypothetical protein C5B44_00865 [Acidobacteria bacterium]|nr:MAG: hypothetical protein C5B44_00865 [Acidobacteriota bacterium]